ncbi:MAG: DUF1549 domain-containing protein [Rubripirellula sp.]|nr:DUF1549 domain-containing protein [Rubripirellula sp.]
MCPVRNVLYWLALLPGIAFAETSLHEQIDALIDTKAKDLPRAEIADDAEFFRRANLDFAGVIPSAEQTLAFLADQTPVKREQAIDALLAGPRYAQTMRERFHIHIMERRGDSEHWLTWLEKSFEANKPWDHMAREIVRADFRDEPNRGAAFFYSKRLEKYGTNPIDYPGVTRDVGRMFLGIDLQCAQCHDHLIIDDYKQQDFHGIFSAISKLQLLRDAEYPGVEEQLMTAKQEFASVFDGEPHEVGPKLPGLDEVDLATFDKGEEYQQSPDRKTKTPGVPKFSPLDEFSKQIANAPPFASNIVNRVWFLMMGRGLVMPMDNFHSQNPASHPALLDLLATEFKSHGYDFKWLFREMALTETYQRSSRLPNGVDRVPGDRFVVAIERRLSAEQLLWSTLRAVGVKPDDAPLENVDEKDDSEEFVGLKQRFVDALGNDPKSPEREFSPSLKAALFVMNDDEVLKLLRRDDALPAKLAVESDDAKVANALFLNIFSRAASEADRSDVAKHLSGFKGRRAEGIAEITWAMLAGTEFVVNH